MAIRVLSFDFDGCLFHIKYIETFPKDVIEQNRVFLDTITYENAEFGLNERALTEVISFIGSNRQSKAIDDVNTFINGYIKGSCFPAIQQVSDYIGAKLNTLLLADIYGDLPEGTSYIRAMDKTLKNPKDHAHWLFDETKVTILYAQIHSMASIRQSAQIIFDFYDDREDILYALLKFYTINSELIPRNVVLRLTRYVDARITPIATIHGSGLIDTHYRETVKHMADISLGEQKRSFTEAVNEGVTIKADEHVTPALLAHKKTLRNFISQIPIIQMNVQQLLIHDHKETMTTVLDLINTLTKFSAEYDQHKMDRENFRSGCIAAISLARLELKEALFLGDFFESLDRATEELGITSKVTGSISEASGAGSPLFFHTECSGDPKVSTVAQTDLTADFT